eukprot:Sspe_Gene.30405::Locus_15058_Transcript_5_10_Confidence_0.083_Length_502::g.30405::m.30405/K02958/RP-S15e, RPS15; small subunit ribosomal protein S15e
MRSSTQLVRVAGAGRRVNGGLKRKADGADQELRKAKRTLPTGEKPRVVKTHLRNIIVVARDDRVGSWGCTTGKVFNPSRSRVTLVGHYLGRVLQSPTIPYPRSSRVSGP